MLPRKNRIPKEDFPSPKRQGFPNQQIRVSDVKNQLFSGIFYFRASERSANEEFALPSERRKYSNLYKNEGELRVSVVVSKKTAKTAVARNLMRRRFYEILQPNLNSFTQQGSLILYPKKETISTKFSVLKEEVESALRKAKLI